jgi:hypothetical protein
MLVDLPICKFMCFRRNLHKQGHQITNVASSPEITSPDRVNSCQQGFVLLGAACARGCLDVTSTHVSSTVTFKPT